MGSSHKNRSSSTTESRHSPTPQKKKREMRVFFLLLVCWLPSLITAEEPALLGCQKLERTRLTGDYEEIPLSGVARGDEKLQACKKACQLNKECVGASIGGRGQKCRLYPEGYGIQNKGRGLRGWTSYTCDTCQKLERTLLTGDYEEIPLSGVARGDEKLQACKKACQVNKECAGASIGGRGQKCRLYPEGYGIQNKGRGLRGWTSYTC